MTDLIPPKLTLDDYSQLISDSLIHTSLVSNGEFTDIDSEASFMRPFAGTLAYIGSEILYKANLTAEAAAKSFLAEVVGIPENVGKKAVTTLQFGLSASLSTNFTIPANFQVSDATGTLRFYTDVALTIPAGATAGQVTATAEEIGNTYNLSSGIVNRFSQPLAYLDYVVNIEPAQGGSEAESATNLIERAAIAIRTRNPVSALDFEQLATLVMGEGSRAKAIGLLAADKLTEQKGAIHLFLLDKDGQPASETLQGLIGEAISPRIMLGTQLITSPIELLDTNIFMIAKATGEKALQDISDQCFQTLIDYFNPESYTIGSPILLEEVKFVLRSIGGFNITSVDINNASLNISMPNAWTMPSFRGLSVQVVDVTGQVFYDSQFIPIPGFE